MKAKKSKSVESGLTASKFMALSDAEKNRIYEEIDSKSTDELLRESKPLNARQKSRWRKMKQVLDDQNNGSAPKTSEKVVAIAVDENLLRQADRFAKKQGMDRSELFSNGLRLVMNAKQ